MPALLGLVFSRGGLIVMTALAIAGVFGVEALRLAHAKHDLTAARAQVVAVQQDLGTCRSNVATLRGQIEAQNRAVDGLKADSDRRAADLARGLQAARKSALASQSAAQRLLAFKAQGADVCSRLLAVDREVLEANR